MTGTIRIEGAAASPGIAIGSAIVLDRKKIRVPKTRISPNEVNAEVDRLMSSVEESREQLTAAIRTIGISDEKHEDHSLILKAHLLMLEDKQLIQGAASRIGDELINAEWAFVRTIDETNQILAGLGDDYFNERTQDVDFVGTRVLRNLMGHTTEIFETRGEPCIIIAESLSPAEIAQMINEPVLGFATVTGTRTSHTSIMAHALGIPAVVGAGRITARVAVGDTVVIDGGRGVVVIRPDEDTIEKYRARATKYAEFDRQLLSTKDQPARTTDGVELQLMANVEFPHEVDTAVKYGAEGIGLYRTEFLYLDRGDPPTEEEQYLAYKSVLEAIYPRHVVFRTFDIGSDKTTDGENFRELNPALGMRAIRIGLKNREMYRTQIRAMLRAATCGELSIMFPMISGVGELREVKALVEEARKELGQDETCEIKIGCMIELPSAVLIADQLAKEADFFSIGTNDLVQYALAIDRLNDLVAYLYTPYHPAVLRAVGMIVNAANEANIPVSMCGGMASEPQLAPVLAGLGLRNLSMTPASIPMVKKVIQKINSVDAKNLAKEALDLPTVSEIEDLVTDFVKAKVGTDLDAV